jgi:hypothetical protein
MRAIPGFGRRKIAWAKLECKHFALLAAVAGQAGAGVDSHQLASKNGMMPFSSIPDK